MRTSNVTMPRPLGDGKLLLTVVLGLAGGIVIGHVFKRYVNKIFTDIPALSKFKAND
jgi:hypothetical protein